MNDDTPTPPSPSVADDYYLPAGAGSHHRLFPGVEVHTHAGDRLMLSLVTFEPRSSVPSHHHPHEQMGVMISGHLDFTIGGVTRRLGPGDQWRIPSGVPHEVHALDEPAVALDVFHPVREDYR
jgi:quercetin dioxygenase-like cupin family protein